MALSRAHDANRQKISTLKCGYGEERKRSAVTNEEVLRTANEDRQILNSIWQRKHRWIDHVLRHDGLLHEIIEGGKRGKPTRGRRIQMPHDLANDVGSDALKRAAEDRDTEKGCQKRAVRQKTTDDESNTSTKAAHPSILVNKCRSKTHQ